MGDIVHQELGRTAGRLGDAVEMLLEERGLGDQRGERRAELVGHVGGESPLARLRLLERADLRLEGFRHLVERRGPLAELVVRGHREPRGQEPLGHRSRGVAGLRHRREGPGGDDPPDGRREHQDRDPPGGQHRGELAKVGAKRVLREEQVQLHGRARRAGAHHQVGALAHLEPFVRDVPRGDELPEAARELGVDRGIGGESALPGDDHGADPALPLVGHRELLEVPRLRGEVRGRAQAHAGLALRSVEGVAEARLPDQDERPERQRAGEHPGDGDERDRQPAAHPGGGRHGPMHVSPARACTPRPGRWR